MTLTRIVKSAGAASLLLLAAFGLSGCGRRGDLEVPGAPKAAATGAGSIAASKARGSIDNPSAPVKDTTKIVAPKRDFLLDPLL